MVKSALLLCYLVLAVSLSHLSPFVTSYKINVTEEVDLLILYDHGIDVFDSIRYRDSLVRDFEEPTAKQVNDLSKPLLKFLTTTRHELAGQLFTFEGDIRKANIDDVRIAEAEIPKLREMLKLVSTRFTGDANNFRSLIDLFERDGFVEDKETREDLIEIVRELDDLLRVEY